MNQLVTPDDATERAGRAYVFANHSDDLRPNRSRKNRVFRIGRTVDEQEPISVTPFRSLTAAERAGHDDRIVRVVKTRNRHLKLPENRIRPRARGANPTPVGADARSEHIDRRTHGKSLSDQSSTGDFS